jgi:hypothetical protein
VSHRRPDAKRRSSEHDFGPSRTSTRSAHDRVVEPSGSGWPPPSPPSPPSTSSTSSPPPEVCLKSGLPRPTSVDAARSRKVSSGGRRRWCWQAVIGGAVIPAAAIVAFCLVLGESTGNTHILSQGRATTFVDFLIVWVLGAAMAVLPAAGLPLGVIAAVKISRSNGALKGKVFTVFAIVVGVCWLIVAASALGDIAS